MRKLLPGSVALIAAGLCGTGVPAVAADLGIEAPSYKAPVPIIRTYDWTGFYIGGNVGGHWGSDKITTSTDVNFEGLGTAAGAAIDAASPVTLHPEGFIGGVQAGYNLEGSGGVFGIEVDANWLGGTASRTLSNIPVISAGDQMTNSVEATFLSTLRMRWGTTVISDRSLLFITAGFAFETLKTSDTMGHNGNALITSTSGSTTEPGLTVGAGFEYAITDNISAKAEYLFVAIKDVNTTIPSTGAFADSIGVTHNYIDQVARFGLNFKFGG
ncbi:MAG TPA: outer membrane beta-barrel protein [Xanthobacteraceae bacterium]|jgi:outer membrane immunogenic protein|nr:outer membrane beta-barrel protein [Xanthobacteraceae bacterium]